MGGHIGEGETGGRGEKGRAFGIGWGEGGASGKAYFRRWGRGLEEHLAARRPAPPVFSTSATKCIYAFVLSHDFKGFWGGRAKNLMFFNVFWVERRKT